MKNLSIFHEEFVNFFIKELTKLQYKMTLRCEGSLMPQNIDSLKQENENGSLLQSTSSLAEEESKFFSPAFFSRQVCLYSIILLLGVRGNSTASVYFPSIPLHV